MATTTGWGYQSTAYGTTSPATGAAPTLATDGQAIQDLGAITIVVEAPTGQTLSGAGTLAAWVYFPFNVGGIANTPLGWVRLPQADITVSTSGQQRIAFTPYNVVAPVRSARLAYVPTGITFSGGSTGVVVYQLGSGSAVQRRST